MGQSSWSEGSGQINSSPKCSQSLHSCSLALRPPLPWTRIKLPPGSIFVAEFTFFLRIRNHGTMPMASASFMMRIFGRDTVIGFGTAPTTRSQKGFGGRQTEHCCPGLLGGAQEKTAQGNQLEEIMRTVLLLVSLAAMRLASGGISPALLRFTMVVKEISE